MSNISVEILIPFKYFKKGQTILVSEANAHGLVAKGLAKIVAADFGVETKESPKKLIGKESE